MSVLVNSLFISLYTYVYKFYSSSVKSPFVVSSDKITKECNFEL